jgi:hypothetical protein
MVSYAVFIYNRRLYTQYVYTFFEGAAAGKFDEYHSLRAPYGLPTGSLRAPYGLPTGSLRAPYGLPTGSLRAPYGSASSPCLSEGRTARGEANLWACYISHVFPMEESASIGVTACSLPSERRHRIGYQRLPVPLRPPPSL